MKEVKKYLEKYGTIYNAINNFRNWKNDKNAYKILGDIFKLLFETNGGKNDIEYVNGSLNKKRNDYKFDADMIMSVIDSVKKGNKEAIRILLYLIAIIDIYSEKINGIFDNMIKFIFIEILNKYKSEFIEELKKVENKVVCHCYDYFIRKNHELKNEQTLVAYIILLKENLCKDKSIMESFRFIFIEYFVDAIKIGGFSFIDILVKELIDFDDISFINHLLDKIYNSNVKNDIYKLVKLSPLLAKSDEIIQKKYAIVIIKNVSSLKELEIMDNIEFYMTNFFKIMKFVCNDYKYKEYWDGIVELIFKYSIDGTGKNYECYKNSGRNDLIDIFDI